MFKEFIGKLQLDLVEKQKAIEGVRSAEDPEKTTMLHPQVYSKEQAEKLAILEKKDTQEYARELGRIQAQKKVKKVFK